MSGLLPSFERMLGSLTLWSRDILSYLFLISPTPYTIHDLSTFFFGNDIPLHLALAFFRKVPLPHPTKLTPFFHNTMLGTAISTDSIVSTTMT